MLDKYACTCLTSGEESSLLVPGTGVLACTDVVVELATVVLVAVVALVLEEPREELLVCTLETKK